MELLAMVGYIHVLSVLLAMLMAASSDLRTRIVSDRYWAFIGFSGVAVELGMSAVSDALRWEYCADALAGALFLTAVLYDNGRIDVLLGCTSVLLAGLVLFCGEKDPRMITGSVSVMVCVLFLVAYWFGAIRGGADTKCLISLGLAFPAYSEFGIIVDNDVPEMFSIVFSPSVIILLLASVLSVFGCAVYCIMKNIRAGSPVAISTFLASPETASGAFVWPVEDVIGGKRTRCAIPDDFETERIYEKFVAEKIKDIRVTPMVPFIVPMAVAFAVVVLVGNPVITV